jgi:hypothetical protein
MDTSVSEFADFIHTLASALKMEATSSSETLVATYRSTLYHNPENHNPKDVVTHSLVII